MSRSLRILHLADSHIGAELPARPRSLRRHRGDDFVDSYRRALAPAIAGQFDLVLHAGDVFDIPAPSDAAVTAAAGPLLAAAAAGAPVVILPGNHERAVIPTSVLLAHPNIHIVDQPRTLRFELRGRSVAVAAFPFIRKIAAEFDAALVATEWKPETADVNILAMHQTVESAVVGPANYCFRSGDDVLDRDRIPRAFHYVALGHVHRHQALRHPSFGGPPIVYAGSCDRITFAERDEPKGAVHIEIDDRGDLTHRHVEHDVRPMLVVPIDISGGSAERTLRLTLSKLEAIPPDAVVNLRLTGQASRRALRGLRFSERVRAARPDIQLSVAGRAVEIVPERVVARRSAKRLVSAFSAIDERDADVARVSADRAQALPKSCGTYALWSADGRLLYVGKARNLRTRIQTHLRGRKRDTYGVEWMRDVARVEFRRADSELEALLVEAELIRNLQPPFNTQMRLWSRYCYLVENGRSFGQLGISREAPWDRPSYGPFRSRSSAAEIEAILAAFLGIALCPDASKQESPRLDGGDAARLCERFFAGICSGPCGGRTTDADYAALIGRRATILAGEDDAEIVAAELAAVQMASDSSEVPAADAVQETSRALRSISEYARELRVAEALLERTVVIPRVDGRQKLLTLGRGGLRIRIGPRPKGAGVAELAALTTHLLPASPEENSASGEASDDSKPPRRYSARVPRELLDVLLTAARALRSSKAVTPELAPSR